MSLCDFFLSSRASFLIFTAVFLRSFCYTATAVIFMAYLLDSMAVAEATATIVLTYLTDFFVSMAFTSKADAYGRRLSLFLASLLMCCFGLTWGLTTNVALMIVLGACVGILSPSGTGGLGPYSSLEQAALSNMVLRAEHIPKDDRAAALASMLGIYSMVGSVAQAVGAVTCGFAVAHLQQPSELGSAQKAHQAVFLAYAVIAGVMALVYAGLPRDVELTEEEAEKIRKKEEQKKRQDEQNRLKLLSHQHHHNDHAEAGGIVSEKPKGGNAAADDDDDGDDGEEDPGCFAKFGFLRMSTVRITALFSSLFFVDSLAGGLITQSYFSYWCLKRWDFSPSGAGLVLAGINIISGLTSLSTGWMVGKCGALRTMVFTHLPSNILLGLIPLMPSSWSAVALLILRYSISQMDVPARQALVALAVPVDEKSCSGGATTAIRSLGVALSAVVLLPLITQPTSLRPSGSNVTNSSGISSSSSAPVHYLSESDKLWLDLPIYIAAGMKILYDIAVYFVFNAFLHIGKKEKKKGEAVPSGSPAASGEGSSSPAPAAAAQANESTKLLHK